MSHPTTIGRRPGVSDAASRLKLCCGSEPPTISLTTAGIGPRPRPRVEVRLVLDLDRIEGETRRTHATEILAAFRGCRSASPPPPVRRCAARPPARDCQGEPAPGADRPPTRRPSQP